jgi:hypothetical protein
MGRRSTTASRHCGRSTSQRQATNEDERAVLYRWREVSHDERLTRNKYTTNRRSWPKEGTHTSATVLMNAAVTTPIRGPHTSQSSTNLHDTIHRALAPSPAPMHKRQYRTTSTPSQSRAHKRRSCQHANTRVIGRGHKCINHRDTIAHHVNGMRRRTAHSSTYRLTPS